MTIQLVSEPAIPTEGMLLPDGTGEHESLEVIYDRFGPPVWEMVHRIVQDEAKSDEVTCHVLFEVWLKPNGVDATVAGTYSWVLGLARSHALAWWLAQVPAVEYQEWTKSPGKSGPIDESDIRRALADLSVLQRKSIGLVYYQGLRRDEAAIILKISRAAVTAALSFGLLRLREAIQGNRTLGRPPGADPFSEMKR
jgi:RNA polymerase sigma-70 factor (ECF subfamily)